MFPLTKLIQPEHEMPEPANLDSHLLHARGYKSDDVKQARNGAAHAAHHIPDLTQVVPVPPRDFSQFDLDPEDACHVFVGV
jgi:hypothetical protein